MLRMHSCNVQLTKTHTHTHTHQYTINQPNLFQHQPLFTGHKWKSRHTNLMSVDRTWSGTMLSKKTTLKMDIIHEIQQVSLLLPILKNYPSACSRKLISAKRQSHYMQVPSLENQGWCTIYIYLLRTLRLHGET